MFFVNEERVTARSENTSTASSCCVDLGDALETKPNAFSASPKAALAASGLNFSLDKRCLPQMALPCGMRPDQHASQEQLHVELLAHVRPPM